MPKAGYGTTIEFSFRISDGHALWNTRDFWLS
jgi:hypothetical protein